MKGRCRVLVVSPVISISGREEHSGPIFSGIHLMAVDPTSSGEVTFSCGNTIAGLVDSKITDPSRLSSFQDP
ncbi:unnamed protein product [Haemonchus placei]|uniref:Uncharacterized protein n=1 Tax=Haemonchus placei TaxID=6290 RepID=A0A0N4W0G7_HAEPC|nr:unnamed protein product [Haemonchus placei]